LKKLAATVVLEDNVTVQSPVPVHAPLQPAKLNPAFALAFNITVFPAAKV
jgi:hypothetical protein